MSTGPPGRVIHIRDGQAFDVYVGRPGPWGNPWHVGRDGTRQEVIVRHREWLDLQLREHFTRGDHDWVRKLADLRGKTLACYCYPKACHGWTLLEFADRAYWMLRERDG